MPAERVKRLLVPLLFGVLILIPPQTWFGARFNSGYQGSYLHYLSGDAFFSIDFREGGDYFGGLGIGHLWFILFLLIISLAALPLWGGRREEGSRVVSLSRFLAHPGAWPLAGLAILLGEALPDIGGKNIFYYFVFFTLGYLALCSEGSWQRRDASPGSRFRSAGPGRWGGWSSRPGGTAWRTPRRRWWG